MVLQPAFMPSTTIFDERRRRYLVWNNVGTIINTHRDDGASHVEINIKHNNNTLQHKEDFHDLDRFSMASLSNEGAIFATSPISNTKRSFEMMMTDEKKEESEESALGSTVYYHAFAGQKHMQNVNESFRVVLPAGENAQCVAVGKGFLAVATSKDVLRIYTSTGMPVEVISMSGQVVSCVGHDTKLVVVTHVGNTNCMESITFDVNWQAGCEICIDAKAAPLPLSRGAKLVWTGFDVDMHTFVALDSHGILRNLSRISSGSSGWRWMPVLDVNVAKTEVDMVFWPVTVQKSCLVYVLLHGSKSKPLVYPLPVVSMVQLRVTIALEVPVPTTMKKSNKSKPKKRNPKQTGDGAQSLLLQNARMRHLEATNIEINRLSAAKIADLPLESGELEQRLDVQRDNVDLQLVKNLQDAIVVGDIPRALNLCLCMRSMETLKIGIRVANHFEKKLVAQTLQAILDYKKKQEHYLF